MKGQGRMKGISAELTLHLPVSLEHLHLATGISRIMCEAVQDPALPSDFADSVELAVSEACTNAILHAQDPNGTEDLDILFTVTEDSLVVDLTDHGPGFALEEVPEPDFDSHPEGGYGLYIIRSVMDEVRYNKSNTGNTLTMVKYYRGLSKAPL